MRQLEITFYEIIDGMERQGLLTVDQAEGLRVLLVDIDDYDANGFESRVRQLLGDDAMGLTG